MICPIDGFGMRRPTTIGVPNGTYPNENHGLFEGLDR